MRKYIIGLALIFVISLSAAPCKSKSKKNKLKVHLLKKKLEIVKALHSGDYQKLKTVFKQESNIAPYANLSSDNNSTPLMYFSFKGSEKNVERLLAAGVKVNVQNQSGATALSYACRKGKLNTVKMLLKENANVDIGKDEGLAPLIAAMAYTSNYIRRKKIVHELIAAGADTDVYDEQGNSFENLAKKAQDKETLAIITCVKAGHSVPTYEQVCNMVVHQEREKESKHLWPLHQECIIL